jgi:hypothetical protein
MAKKLCRTTMAEAAEKITLPPHWEVDLTETHSHHDGYLRDPSVIQDVTVVGLHTTVTRKDACNPDGKRGWNDLGMGDYPCKSLEDVARQIIVGLLTDCLHEALEFVTIDGEPFAAAHTTHEEQFEWMENRFRRLLTDYRRQFPPEKNVKPNRD